jgi:thioredoxin-related protein
MMLRNYVIAITLSLSLLTPTVTTAGVGNDPYKYFFNETWGDFREELANAKQQNKKGILIFFEMDECPFCHYMKNNVLNQPEVQAFYRENFLNFTVDIEGDVEITNMEGKVTKQKDFAFLENRVRATPVIAFFDLDGNRIFRHTGKTSGVEEFIWMGQYVAGGSYKETSFTRYKRNKREEKKK